MHASIFFIFLYLEVQKRVIAGLQEGNARRHSAAKRSEATHGHNAGRELMEAQRVYTQKDSLRIALEGVLLISWRLPTLPRVCSTIGVTGLNFSVRNGKRWNPGAITTRMGDMMNATLFLQTTTSLKKCAEETKPRGFYAMIYRSFLFSLIVFATRSEVRLTAYTGMILFFPALVRFLYI